MPYRAALVLAAVFAVVHTVPVDEISVRNDIGPAGEGHLSAIVNDCTGSFVECKPSESSLLEIAQGNAENPEELGSLTTILESGGILGGGRLSKTTGADPFALLELNSGDERAMTHLV